MAQGSVKVKRIKIKKKIPKEKDKYLNFCIVKLQGQEKSKLCNKLVCLTANLETFS